MLIFSTCCTICDSRYLFLLRYLLFDVADNEILHCNRGQWAKKIKYREISRTQISSQYSILDLLEAWADSWEGTTENPGHKESRHAGNISHHLHHKEREDLVSFFDLERKFIKSQSSTFSNNMKFCYGSLVLDLFSASRPSRFAKTLSFLLEFLSFLCVSFNFFMISVSYPLEQAVFRHILHFCMQIWCL